ncbi:mucolipin-3-like [Scyliorhinus canicula]|uniref:mucolipin-3-like n=1 Tax=Scyliorhinus canicula TaxID=7830 RepID=UPI0018F64709|nr:mucolipin-3-like [Scyliorhinus canicula]
MSANNPCLNESMDFQFTTIPSADSTDEEWRLREDLNYFFMSPCEKYRARRQFPWKLCLQVLKIGIVTTQLIIFGLSNQLVASFKEENSIAFKHLFLKGYQDVNENGASFELYTQQDVYDSVSYSINQYLQLQNMTVGNYGYGPNGNNKTSLQICKQLYKKNIPVTPSSKLAINPEIETDCFTIEPNDIPKEWKINNSSFFDLEFYRLILLEITFKLKGIDLQTIRNNELPDCYAFRITITFNNAAHSGIIKISLETGTSSRECKDWKISGSRTNLTTYDVCSIFLGTSTLFAWVGVLRYLGYFQKYNVLILTMRGALPKVLRFCCCAGMIYLGYMFCGWIVLGPYHSKFVKLSAVAECLFSLINGDDMFATFAEIQEKSNLLWLFSRIYLYSFISLFIYMILSLFIALITDTYETIKKCQRNGFPQTDLHSFMTDCSVNPDFSRHGSTDDDDRLLL